MRNITAGYYLPTEEDFKKLWSTGTFVLDTNTLLNLYRYPDRAREDTFAVFEKLANEKRLWIPFQVALEFQLNRIKVIGEQLARFSKVSAQIAESVSDIEKDLAALELDQRGIDVNQLVQEFRQRSEALCDALTSVAGKHVQIVGEDAIRDRFDAVIGDSVGLPPKDQAWLDAIYVEGAVRYAKNVPPGYLDKSKAERPNEAAYVYKDLVFERQYGDLILWKQLLAHAQEQNVSHVTFVTGDRKEDWWWRFDGKTIGPHPSLTEEALRVADIKVFHMYTMDRLLEQAKTHLNVGVHDESIKEIEQISSRYVQPESGSLSVTGAAPSVSVTEGGEANHRFGFGRVNSQAAEHAVLNWLQTKYPNEEIRRGDFPDFVVSDSTQGSPVQLHGYAVKIVRNEHVVGGGFTAFLARTLAQGYETIHDNRVNHFSIILVLTGLPFGTFLSQIGQRLPLIERARALLDQYPITSIVIGAMLRNRFIDLVTVPEGPTK